AKAASARRCALPSARESRSMADKEKADKDGKADKPAKADKPKGERQAKGEQPPKGGQQAKGERAPKGDKGKPTDGKAGKGEKPAAPRERRVPARLHTLFNEVVRKKLIEQFGYKNPMQVPALDKIVINMGVGEGVNDRKKVETAAADLGLIAGQKAVIT